MRPIVIEDPSRLANDATCPACNKQFIANDRIALIPLGPGDDPEEQAKARAGRPYNAVAAVVHWDCAGAVED